MSQQQAGSTSKKRKRRSTCRSDSRNRFENDTLDQSLPFFFDLPISCRVLVDSAAPLGMLDSVVADAAILGIDTETRPSMYKNKNKSPSKQKNKTALIQICTRSERGNEMVFIVDLISLAKLNILPVLDAALAPALADENVIKLGHGLMLDFKELRESYPEMKAFNNIQNVYDTAKMYRKLRPHEKNSISLKKLTMMFLHLNLIKSQTCSDWELRPLSESQLHYCACDALVLLRLYDTMSFEAMDMFGVEDGADTFDDIVYSIVPSEGSAEVDVVEERSNRKDGFIVLGQTVSETSSHDESFESDFDEDMIRNKASSVYPPAEGVLCFDDDGNDMTSQKRKIIKH